TPECADRLHPRSPTATATLTHPYWERFDRSIDYIWLRGPLDCTTSAVGFNKPHPDDPTLWPSDHAGVWADLKWA
ncbi:MAG: hypothetical protein HC861_10625, partial [Rhodospirillaceae bacterium]|nr:hypothetical protein [Rhodospirillaceae bacterium]